MNMIVTAVRLMIFIHLPANRESYKHQASREMQEDVEIPDNKNLKTRSIAMNTTTAIPIDSMVLSKINAQFIQNFLKQDTVSHSEIIHKNFVCIESNGAIVDRATYLKNWLTDFDNSGYESFTYKDEYIRIFGNIALVRAKTVYTKTVEGKKIEGYTIYTDTYMKENGKWQCIQVQITPVKTN